MAKSAAGAKSLGQLSNEVYDLVGELTAEDRNKVLTAVMSLCGDAEGVTENIQRHGASGIVNNSHRHGASGTPFRPSSQSGSQTPQHYYAAKQAQNKGEMLAVAAKYHEEQNDGATSTQEDFAKFFREARQNFDRNNFARDMKNATNRAHFFNKGTPRGQYQLSFYGQQYVDAMPDRAAIKALRKPGRKPKKGSSKKVGK